MSEIHEATIRLGNAAVELIKVDERRLTLAVYRQLREAFPYTFDDETGYVHPYGEIWGWVNICLPKCKRRRPHRHVIWSDGETLFRGTVGDDSEMTQEEDEAFGPVSRLLWRLVSDLPQLFIAA